jgi:prophage regulatory protein
MRILAFADLRPEKGIRYSRQYIGRLERDGRFPKRVRLGEKCSGWIEGEIDAWLKSKADARNTSKIPEVAADDR